MSIGPVIDRRKAMATTAAATLIPCAATAASAAPPRETAKAHRWSLRDIAFDDQWSFFLGTADGAQDENFDDTAWRRVDLPHDWSIEDLASQEAGQRVGPFARKALGSNATGFTVGGEGWYRKRFRTDGYPQGARIEIVFDGLYQKAQFWLNGHPLGSTVHGYIPARFDLTPFLRSDGDNVLVVQVRNEGRNSRWYAGSGIYRSVTLDVMPASGGIDRWAIAAFTRRLANGKAEIEVATTFARPDPAATLVTRLRDAAGKVVATAQATVSREVRQALTVRAPRLWSPDAPNLYTLETELRRGDVAVDRVDQPFGIRIVTFDPQRGMCINGTATPLRGGCIHHDNGLLGACAYADADDRRVRLLKARGFNAIRSAHNPASRSLRGACDRLGMLVIEEAFDAWHESKEPQDFAADFPQHWEEVVRAMVLPARNSPSVIMWSIGNEIPSRATDEGVRWEWLLANAVKRLDPTRPVTAGLNGVLGQEMIASAPTARPGQAGKVDNASTIFLDVPGYNYRLEDIEREHGQHPERVVYASETFPREVFEYAALMERAPYFLGEFVWTAMDYIGEAGIGATAFLKTGNPPFYFAGWPWVNAWCGDIDLIGQQKAASLARDVAWGLSPLEMLVQRPAPEGTYPWVSNWGWPDELASWDWPDALGKPLTVRIYTAGDRVQLLLNGRQVGEQAISADQRKTASFTVPFAPGTIEAVSWKGGKIVARRRLVTPGAAVSLRIVAEKGGGQRGRKALRFLTVEVIDASGQVLPGDQRALSLTIAGSAEIAAFGSADPLASGSLRSPTTRSFRGRALAILRGTGPGTETATITATSPGLTPASVKVRI